jgi:hypothetical protein
LRAKKSLLADMGASTAEPSETREQP